MNIQMQVHAIRQGTIEKTVTLNGQALAATLRQTEVELVDPEGVHGTMTFRFVTDEDRAYAAEKFVQDTMVSISIG